MIAIIATVCLAASTAAAYPASQEGHQLISYTQSLGEPCHMVSNCKNGLKCTSGLFGTGKCVSKASVLRANNARKLTQNTDGGKCDIATPCGTGMHCSGQNLGIFGTGHCIRHFVNYFKSGLGKGTDIRY